MVPYLALSLASKHRFFVVHHHGHYDKGICLVT